MQISRRDLYNRVWSTPMSKLARELDISDVGLAKACRRHNIPRPPRGYWAKLAAGKAPPKPALPSAKIDTVELDAARHRIAETPKVEIDRASIKAAQAAQGDALAGVAAATFERLTNAKPSADGFVTFGSSRVIACSLSPATVGRQARLRAGRRRPRWSAPRCDAAAIALLSAISITALAMSGWAPLLVGVSLVLLYTPLVVTARLLWRCRTRGQVDRAMEIAKCRALGRPLLHRVK